MNTVEAFQGDLRYCVQIALEHKKIDKLYYFFAGILLYHIHNSIIPTNHMYIVWKPKAGTTDTTKKTNGFQEGCIISRQNLNEKLETLHLAPTLFYHLPGV